MADNKAKTTAAAKLAHAIAHPLRIEILEGLDKGQQFSPVAYSSEHGHSLGVVSYHFKNLLEAGAVAIVAEVPRRGAVEHVYGITKQGKALRKFAASL